MSASVTVVIRAGKPELTKTPSCLSVDAASSRVSLANGIRLAVISMLQVELTEKFSWWNHSMSSRRSL